MDALSRGTSDTPYQLPSRWHSWTGPERAAKRTQKRRLLFKNTSLGDHQIFINFSDVKRGLCTASIEVVCARYKAENLRNPQIPKKAFDLHLIYQ
ncbi:hypothetical protein DSM14862_03789 (plasmid) [Sulfitobacter indolifex]|nr:hypothetical protein DSM14862_03789 [Sulfitobacter indolifex]